MKFLFAAVALVFIFTGCSSSQTSSGSEVWTAFVFPDQANIKRSIQFGKFPSLEICQEASDAKLVQINAKEIGFSECGLNCSFHEGMKTTICERVVTRK
ncbi:MAG: hypothetical protein WC141_03955 [Arcobacteraceae bacterium]